MRGVLVVAVVLSMACVPGPEELVVPPGMVPPGSSPDSARASCDELYKAGVRISGQYYINPSGRSPFVAYCDMQTEGGGWALVYNSVLGVNTLEFWNIPYAERLGRRGTPGTWGNYYDGSIYQEGRRYLDVIEDLRGKAVVALEATATGINTTSMRFESPSYVAGNTGVFNHQFGNGWSAPDHEGDALPGQNCSVLFGNVTQHYGDCWGYNLGSDADGPTTDFSVGPHLHSPIASSLGLVSDGTAYTRVRRISRFAKW